MLSLAPLLVDAPGAMATITKAVLHLEDPDNAAEVLLVVLEPPRHGRIARLHGDGELGRFSLEQLSRGQVVYLHDGSPAPTADLFVLQVNDQHHYLNVPVQVLIAHTVGPLYRSLSLSVGPLYRSLSLSLSLSVGPVTLPVSLSLCRPCHSTCLYLSLSNQNQKSFIA